MICLERFILSKEEVLLFNKIQMKEMEDHRWLESEKEGHDIGENAYLDWILKHAKKFREEWFDKHKKAV